MSFSMPSYFLGVGTVVGALALGFSGGIVLTKTAIKDTPAGPSRIERAARSDPASTAQLTEAKATAMPRADAVQPAEPVRHNPGSQVQAAEPKSSADVKPVADTVRPEPAKVVEPVRQIDTSKPADRPVPQADMPRQMEQPVQQADVPQQTELPARRIEARQGEQPEVEQRVEREQRRAEQRRIDRERRAAERERRAKTMITVRRQRPMEDEQDQPVQRELAFEREEPRPNLFEGLFGRPAVGESRE